MRHVIMDKFGGGSKVVVPYNKQATTRNPFH